MLNKVMIIGRLGRDPELRYTQSGSPVASLNIAKRFSVGDVRAKPISAKVDNRTQIQTVISYDA